MESEIKMLKDREIDQKNQASGYETLLRDKIPLNEHFLALKNKYNNEKNDIEEDKKLRENEIQNVIDNNDDKKQTISTLKNNYENAVMKLQETKDKSMQQIKR